MSNLNLTFGIELEFICVYPPGRFGGVLSNYAEQNAGKFIFQGLRQKGIPATGHEDDDEIFAADQPSYSMWRVEEDMLVLSEGELAHLPAGWEMEAIELSSRKFNLAHYDWQGANGEITAVLGVVESLKGFGCVVLTNQSTGFHVHIGNNNENVPLRTAKNLFKLVTAFENRFDHLHTAPRIAIPDSFSYGEYAHCYAPPSFFHMNNSSKQASQTVTGRFDVIDGVQDFEGLGSLFSCDMPGLADVLGPNNRTHGKLSAYNFDNLFATEEYDRSDETLTRTIEFRQHAGTVNYRDIMAWILLTSKMVSFSHQASDAQILQLRDRANDPAIGVLDVLQAIGCHASVVQHYQNKMSEDVYLAQRNRMMQLAQALQQGVANPMQGLRWQNMLEEFGRSDLAAVRATVANKARSGCYGLERVRTQDEVTAAAGLLALRTSGGSQADPVQPE